MNLYEIDVQLAEVMEMAEAYAIEHDGELPESLAETLDNLESEKDVKIGNICKYIKSQFALESAIKAEAKALTDRARVIHSRAEWMKTVYLADFLNGEKWEDTNSKVSYRKSESVKLNIEPEKLPEEYQRIKIDADKTEIKKALKAGEKISGASLITKQNIQLK